MSDVNAADLGTAQSPLPGLDASDYGGYGTGGNLMSAASSGIFGSGVSALGAGALGLGAAGLGYLISQGPGQLPSQYLQAEGNVPGMEANATGLEAQGGALTAQGTSALAMAQAGQLTPEQQAQLSQYSSGLQNQSYQMFESMGRNPDQDTAFLSQQGNIDTQVNAMAQQQIQSTIQLALGEISGGSSLTGQGVSEMNAANQVLIQAGQAQVQLDQQYSSSLTSAFSAVGSLFGAVAGAAKAAGPAAALLAA